MFYILFIMFRIVFWHGQKAEWLSTASGTFYDKSQARARMRALAAQCDHCVDFRIETIQ